MTNRNHPKQFHRSNLKLGAAPNSKGEYYNFGNCHKDTGLVDVGAKNLKGSQLDHLIDWLQRARKYQKFIKKAKS